MSNQIQEPSGTSQRKTNDKIIKKTDVWDNTYYDYVSYFNPYKINQEKMDIFVKGIPYVFMSCPVLNLTKDNIYADSFLAYMATSSHQNRMILSHLTNSKFTDALHKSLGTCNHRLIPLVTNCAVSIDLKDTSARTKEVGESWYGYKQVHPGSIVDSIVGDEISIKYLEMQDLPIIKMHKAWQQYIENVRRGIFLPSKKAIDDGFIDYMSSIYYILCDFDGETIRYWAKYTGVTPINVPYSSLGGDFNSHDIPDVTINYLYCYKEDMTMAVLRDFNRLCTNDSSIFNLQWGEGRDTGDKGVATKKAIDTITESKYSDKTISPWVNLTTKKGHKGNLYPQIYAVNTTNEDNERTGYKLKLKFY